MDELNAFAMDGREQRRRPASIEKSIVKDAFVKLTTSKRNLTNEVGTSPSADVFEKRKTKKHKSGRSIAPPGGNSVADIARLGNGGTHGLRNQPQLPLGHNLAELKFGKSTNQVRAVHHIPACSCRFRSRCSAPRSRPNAPRGHNDEDSMSRLLFDVNPFLFYPQKRRL